MSPSNTFIRVIRLAIVVFIIVFVLAGGVILLTDPKFLKKEIAKKEIDNPIQGLWQAPDTSSIPKDERGKKIRYGKELIAHTAKYLGPNGSVLQISSGMNCQNCHLEAGTKPFGNNYGSVASQYPKFRARSGSVESIEKRVNDCIERSLNGKNLDTLSYEMRSIVAYITWLGKEVPAGDKAKGSGFYEISLLERAADPVKGNLLYTDKCIACHGLKGEGIRKPAGDEYLYPPLSGENSFTTGAGLLRISNFAKYIFTNMPQGATYDKPLLTEEESWDIAAYVVSLPRPEKIFSSDWPKIETKPMDHPFGPYADKFSEAQHKYGPFKPILESQN